MKIEVNAGLYTKEIKKVIRQLYKDKYGFYIKQGGYFPIAVENELGWKIINEVPFDVAHHRRDNHTEDNKVK